MIDSRENVYRKKGSRYIPVGKINSHYDYDGFKSAGLWLHTERNGGSIRSMTLIAKLEELPSSAVAFGSVAKHSDELTKFLTDLSGLGLSRAETAQEILKWISGKAES